MTLRLRTYILYCRLAKKNHIMAIFEHYPLVNGVKGPVADPGGPESRPTRPISSSRMAGDALFARKLSPDPTCQRPPPQPGCPQNHGSTLLPEGTRAHNYSLDIVLLIKFDLFFSPRSLGGMCGAVVTSPFDVVKTRLQSDLFRQKHAGVGAVVGDSVVLVRRPGGILWHFVETAHIIRLRPRLFPCSSIHEISHYTHFIRVARAPK